MYTLVAPMSTVNCFIQLTLNSHTNPEHATLIFTFGVNRLHEVRFLRISYPIVPRRSLLPRWPREVWKKAGEDSLGDVTAHGGV